MDETKAKKEKSKKRTMEQRQKEENAFLDEEEAESFVLSNKNHHKKFELPEDMKDITQSLDYESKVSLFASLAVADMHNRNDRNPRLRCSSIQKESQS